VFRHRRGTWLAAAAVLVVSLGAGFTTGWRAGESRAASAMAMTPPPVETAPAPVVLPSVSIDAPAATRVIRFQPGVDWQDAAGGN
jgi:hypothetical protein